MENKELAQVQQEQKNDLKESVMLYLKSQTSNLNDLEIKQFIALCKIHNLNPLKGEIYAVKYKDKFNILTNYYEYVKKADATGLLEYYEIDIEEQQYQGRTIPKKAVFRGKRKDWTRELVITFYFNEWNLGQSTWLSKPFFMFEKCVLANGLRRLFPNEIANMPYINEELWYQSQSNEAIIKEHIAEIEKKQIQEISKPEPSENEINLEMEKILNE